MRDILLAVGKADFQFAGQLNRLDKTEKVIGCFFCIRQNVKVFSLLDARERGTHHIARKVAAASPGDDPIIK